MVEHGGAACFILLGQLPGSGLVDVLVALAGQRDDLAQWLLEPGRAQALGHRLVGLGQRGYEGRVGLGRLAGFGDLSEVALAHGEGAVDEVAVGGHELVVHLGEEVLPGPVRVPGLGHVDSEVVAHRVRLEAFEHVVDPDAHTTRLAELLAGEVKVLVGRHIEGQVEPSLSVGLAGIRVAHEDARPEDRVERDVVLGKEVVRARGHVVVALLPERLPCLWVASHVLSPAHRGREVATEGLEPDVDALVLVGGVVIDPRDAPLDVARHGSVVEPFIEPALGELAHVGAPRVLGLVEPGIQAVLEVGEQEEGVFGGPELHVHVRVELGARIEQFVRVQRLAAVVALVPTRIGVPTVGARALDVAVRQEPFGLGVVGLFGLALLDVALVLEAPEDLVHPGRVVFRRGAREEIEGDAHVLEDLDVAGVPLVDDLLGRDVLVLGGHGDGCAVLVAAADHEHLVAAHPVEAREDVRRQQRASDVTEVKRAVGIRPGHTDQDALHRAGEAVPSLKGWRPPARGGIQGARQARNPGVRQYAASRGGWFPSGRATTRGSPPLRGVPHAARQGRPAGAQPR